MSDPIAATGADLSSFGSDPTYVPAAKHKAASSGGGGGGVAGWIAKAFKSKSGATIGAAPADDSAGDSANAASKKESGHSSFAFWKKGISKDKRSMSAAAPDSVQSAPPPVSAASPSPSSEHSQSGVLYRPDLDATTDGGLHPPTHTRAATAGSLHGQSLPHSRSDLSLVAADANGASHASGADSNFRDRSTSSAAVPSSSSYYHSTYYSTALSSLTAFQPSSALDARRNSAVSSLHEEAERRPTPPLSAATPDTPSRSQSRTPSATPRHASSASVGAAPAPSASPATAASAPPVVAPSAPSPAPAPSKSLQLKVANFRRMLLEESLDMALLRRMSWQGMPASVRSICWKILLGYLPHTLARRAVTLKKRRQEYREYVEMYYGESQSATEVDPDSASIHRDSSSSGEAPLSSPPAGSPLSGLRPSLGAAGGRSESDNDILRQIKQDVPRTAPGIPFFKRPRSQKSLERMLYIFAVRHPASGYVQGMNDVCTPFYVVFLSEYLYPNAISSATSTCAAAGSSQPMFPDADAPSAPAAPPTPQQASGGEGLGLLSDPAWNNGGGADLSLEDYLDLESDVFWCLSKLLDRIQDCYTFAQPGQKLTKQWTRKTTHAIDGVLTRFVCRPWCCCVYSLGIQRMVYKLRELISRIDSPLDAHLTSQHVQYIHFAFRWVNCLLMREMPMRCILRLWDTYLSEDNAAAATASTLTNSGGAAVAAASSAGTAGTSVGASASASDAASGPSSSSSGLVPQDHYTGFRSFHIYVCAAFLMRFSADLRKLDFQELVLYLQRLPTESWSEKEVETLLAQAFIYKRSVKDVHADCERDRFVLCDLSLTAAGFCGLFSVSSWFHSSPHQLK